jgi:hypothetical protein
MEEQHQENLQYLSDVRTISQKRYRGNDALVIQFSDRTAENGEK